MVIEMIEYIVVFAAVAMVSFLLGMAVYELLCWEFEEPY